MHIYATTEERFWAKVDKNGPIPQFRPDLGPCWLWTGRTDKRGYGSFRCFNHTSTAHRWAYMLFVGSIADELEVDHLCRITSCVNLSHLEPVTSRENMLRGFSPATANAKATHCPRGHPYDLFNTYLYKGHRHCVACKRENVRQYRLSHRSK